MIWIKRPRRFAAAAITAAAALLLAGCLLTPGKFASTLDIRKGGAFTYTYDGEIHLLALSKLAQMGQGAKTEETFTAFCADDDTFEQRDCTPEEEAEQRQAWDDGAAARLAKKDQEAAAMRAMLGGIDPADPAAAEELAARLRRQAGWSRVDYKGDGLFDVRFALSGKLDHDFVFPTLEGFPMANFFVTATRRQGGTVRIDAAGLVSPAGTNPFQAMMMGGMMAGAADEATRVAAEAGEGSVTPPVWPVTEGTFTVTTDGEILANNTDEGAATGARGKTLAWTINVRTKQAPTALIKID
ncbi:hypothetical protein E0504_12145 [Parafrankia sp. BMG5.11]|nr:hypothetical protein E0504_12145 [Parafrankia sp. BMG5.11]